MTGASIAIDPRDNNQNVLKPTARVGSYGLGTSSVYTLPEGMYDHSDPLYSPSLGHVLSHASFPSSQL